MQEVLEMGCCEPSVLKCSAGAPPQDHIERVGEVGRLGKWLDRVGSQLDGGDIKEKQASKKGCEEGKEPIHP